MSQIKVLVVDDEKLIRWSLSEGLAKEGFEVVAAETGEGALKLFASENPNLVLLDWKLPDMDGLTVLGKMKEIDPDCLTIVMTAYGTIEAAVEAMKAGATDFVKKPFDLPEMSLTIRKSLERVRAVREVSQIHDAQRARYTIESFVGLTPPIDRLKALVAKVARSDATTVLIQGESGVGKDLIAKIIHYQSGRADRPFVEINCTSIPETLFESELLGHEKGAYTDAKTLKRGLFELANGGTVFLDEIGDLPGGLQAKLLRLIEDKYFKRVGGVKDIYVDVRVIAATNKNLLDLIRQSRFRDDLYFRLNVVRVMIPPLRERMEDIPLLCQQFIERYSLEFRKKARGVSEEALAILKAYPWPGNVRELRNVIERALILENAEVILPDHLPSELFEYEPPEPETATDHLPFAGGRTSLDEIEKQLIREALDAVGGNQSRAARLLNISRYTLRYRMKKYGFLAGLGDEKEPG